VYTFKWFLHAFSVLRGGEGSAPCALFENARNLSLSHSISDRRRWTAVEGETHRQRRSPLEADIRQLIT
jgi:hypothetical protein